MNSRLRSKAFSSGFMAGFTAPYTFFTLRRMRFSHPTGGDLRVAWSDVGRDLDAAIEIEAKHRMAMDNKILNAEIEDRKLGMWLGAGTLALLLLLAFASALLLDSEVVPGLFLGSAVLGAVGMFIKGRNNGQ